MDVKGRVGWARTNLKLERERGFIILKLFPAGRKPQKNFAFNEEGWIQFIAILKNNKAKFLVYQKRVALAYSQPTVQLTSIDFVIIYKLRTLGKENSVTIVWGRLRNYTIEALHDHVTQEHFLKYLIFCFHYSIYLKALLSIPGI